MTKGLDAYEIVKEECGFAFGQTANGDRVRENLPIIEKELKAFAIISKAYGDYANHKISEYELIMIVSENITY